MCSLNGASSAQVAELAGINKEHDYEGLVYETNSSQKNLHLTPDTSAEVQLPGEGSTDPAKSELSSTQASKTMSDSGGGAVTINSPTAGAGCNHTKLKTDATAAASDASDNMVFLRLQDNPPSESDSNENQTYFLINDFNTGTSTLLSNLFLQSQLGGPLNLGSSQVPATEAECAVSQSISLIENLHAVAQANLIAQTQETIAQQFSLFKEKDDEDADMGDEKSMDDVSVEESQHAQIPVPVGKTEKLTCNVGNCRRTFKTTEELKNHYTFHKPLRCQVSGCGRKFTWPAHLKYHQLTHTGDKQFSCLVDGCGKLFYTEQQRRVHLRSHSGEKPFSCPDCSKSFSTAGNLKNHRRCHTGEKPYVCDADGCNKSFAEYSSLKKHKVTHSGEKPFLCEICNKTFSQSSSRNAHMKRHLEKEQNSAETEEEKSTGENVVVEVVLQSEQDEVLEYGEFVTHTDIQSTAEHEIETQSSSTGSHIKEGSDELQPSRPGHVLLAAEGSGDREPPVMSTDQEEVATGPFIPQDHLPS